MDRIFNLIFVDPFIGEDMKVSIDLTYDEDDKPQWFIESVYSMMYHELKYKFPDRSYTIEEYKKIRAEYFEANEIVPTRNLTLLISVNP